jgi:hypothetical protein
MQKDHYHIPMDQMLAIEGKIGKKENIEAMVKRFSYDEELPLS